ncbi:MAG: sodium:calcium antiporter [Chromatiaceae bacterium]|nr:MAG: sodium:calcium antiporter [Chromatiaceae bacterium]
MLVAWLECLVGFVGLLAGGELLVRGASNLAAAARISPLVIGLTVVAFGTSAPELAVTVQAAWLGSPSLAVGNVVGSNIANVLLILGLAALAAPLLVQSRIVRIDVPIVVAASLGLWLLAMDGGLTRLDGAVMFALLVVYIVWSIVEGRRESPAVQAEFALADLSRGRGSAEVWPQLGLVVLGLVVLVGAAHVLVLGAASIARHFGVSELVIGLTVLAVGTSLPELVASVVASLRGERDIAVGNIVGSNLFNILGVLGVGAMLAPEQLHISAHVLWLDLPIMLATAVVCLPIFFSGYRISRLEGGMFFAYFIAYVSWLVMDATDDPNLRSFELAMLGFVIPLTLIAIGFSLVQTLQMRRARR